MIADDLNDIRLIRKFDINQSHVILFDLVQSRPMKLTIATDHHPVTGAILCFVKI